MHISCTLFHILDESCKQAYFDADLVLKDKVFIYDLSRQRIGWADYDCKFYLISTT